MLIVERVVDIGNENKQRGSRRDMNFIIEDVCEDSGSLFEEVLNREKNRIKEEVRNHERNRK